MRARCQGRGSHLREMIGRVREGDAAGADGCASVSVFARVCVDGGVEREEGGRE